MYTYETTGNGLTIEIFRDGESIYFGQGDDASIVLEQLEETETDEQEQNILGEYDI